MFHLFRRFAGLAAAGVLALILPGTPLIFAQDLVPPAAPAAEAAPAPTPADWVPLEDKVTDLLRYFQNLAPDKSLKGLPGPGHNGFLMICAALVLFMTLPGLALFYGGLVRKKNVLSVCAQCMGIAGLVSLLWWVVGYSLVFGVSFGSPYLGGLENAFMKDVGSAPNSLYSAWGSHSAFAMYQLMFAIITPALIVGAVAERMKFVSILLFIGMWMFVVYFPVAHMVWGATGLMNGLWNGAAKIPAMDFAGGTVVHMTSGWSALVLCLLLGRRAGFGTVKMAPHSMVLCMAGTGMLWVGWYGFNAGSALAADGIAANAFMTTTFAAAIAGLVWAMMEWMFKGRPSVLGFCSGIVAGLVVITPACGYVTATAAVVIGVLGAVVCYLFVMVVKARFGYDDALDTFGVHAIGGTLGAILTGCLATPWANGNLLAVNNSFVKAVEIIDGVQVSNGLQELTRGGIIFNQLKAVALTLFISVVATVCIAIVVRVLVGLRPTAEVEIAGLDLQEHGEEGYTA